MKQTDGGGGREQMNQLCLQGPWLKRCTLGQKAAKFVCRGPRSQCVRPRGPCGLCSHGRYASKCAGSCSNKALFKETSGMDLAHWLWFASPWSR